jgi:hypothetical protein
MIICIVLYLFSLLSETQPTKVDYNAAHDENTYVTETRAIDDYLLDHRWYLSACTVYLLFIL